MGGKVGVAEGDLETDGAAEIVGVAVGAAEGAPDPVTVGAGDVEGAIDTVGEADSVGEEVGAHVLPDFPLPLDDDDDEDDDFEPLELFALELFPLPFELSQSSS